MNYIINAIEASHYHCFAVIFFYIFFTEQKEVEETVRHLEELVKGHDVTFLLLDSREARWLPTLVATFHCKVCPALLILFIFFSDYSVLDLFSNFKFGLSY